MKTFFGPYSANGMAARIGIWQSWSMIGALLGYDIVEWHALDLWWFRKCLNVYVELVIGNCGISSHAGFLLQIV